ncbi:hypothetical protein M9Y10_006981 [Tritrichomonas musculus]|uniref:Surface antigen BspA-like n=1 Tax=Tritrichomonas musculus TaxID=1915356 RepID=A0ABR2J053_9EUKA
MNLNEAEYKIRKFDTKVIQEKIIYSINVEDNTAQVAGTISPLDQIIIPRSIKHESKEYLITSISDYAFQFSKIKIIQFEPDSELRIINRFAFWKSSIEKFTIPPHLTVLCDSSFANCKQLLAIEIPENSELRTIQKNAFWNSTIESLTIPSSLVDLQEGWCCGASNIKRVDVSANNPRYKKYNDELIIGKSSIESDINDVLVFCVRNIKKITIPNFIRIIESHAFGNCEKLQTVEVPSDSQLITIQKEAFYCSSIESLSIPSTLIDLQEDWCYGINNLSNVNISPDNPRYSLLDKKFIVGKSIIESDIFDILVFCFRNAKFASIPSFIKYIDSYAFENCSKLRNIEFSMNSEIKTIEKFAFYNTSIEKVRIPAHLKEIRTSAFCCEKLIHVEIEPNSELSIINDRAFWTSPIKSFAFPPHVTEVNESSFAFCFDLKIVEIDSDILINDTFLHSFKQAIIMIPCRFRNLYSQTL